MSTKLVLECIGIFYLVVQIVLSYFFGEVAIMKGHKPTKYIILCLLFGIAGWILVSALPDLRLRQNNLADPSATNNTQTDKLIDEEIKEKAPLTDEDRKDNLIVGIFAGILILVVVFLLIYFI